MSDSLPLLEKERSVLVQQISQLSDFRSGSITGPKDVAAILTVTVINPAMPATARILV